MHHTPPSSSPTTCRRWPAMTTRSGVGSAVVPFEVKIADDKQDKFLDERLELEADAVLAWAVAGYADYVQRGNRLAEPQSVRVATDDYRSESDAVKRFLNERCRRSPHAGRFP